MAWNTDQPPLEYLRRRIVYYKKKIGMVKGFLKKPDDNFLWRKYGNKLPEIVERSIIRYENIISKFKLAVRVLENSGKFKPQNKWQGKRKKEARTHSQD